VKPSFGNGTLTSKNYNVKPSFGNGTLTSKNYNVKPSFGNGTLTSKNYNVKPSFGNGTLTSKNSIVKANNGKLITSQIMPMTPSCKCKKCVKDVHFTNMRIMFNSIINPLLNDILNDDGVMIVDIPLVSMLQDNTEIMVDHIKSLAKSMVQIQNKLPCSTSNNWDEENTFWGGKRKTRKHGMKNNISLRRRKF
jgi:broad specificity polyphosphatase/5'/3'-nucleotidase SurE